MIFRTVFPFFLWFLFAPILCVTTALAQDTETKQTGVRWQSVELSFKAADRHQNPYEDILLEATVTGPDDRTRKIEGFYDGDDTWKVRFCPDQPGLWKWTTGCNQADSGLSGRSGTVDVGPAAADGNPLHEHGGLLKVSENRRCLTYSDGTPFFWLGDTWWWCPGSHVSIHGSTNPEIKSMYRHLIAKRKQQGFNIVHWASLGNFGPHASFGTFMRTRGKSPFDPNYWKTYDLYVKEANEAGIVPVIGFGFHTGVDPHSLEDLQFLWRYVTARYGASSVTWLICGEYNQKGGNRAERIEKVLKLGAFIKEKDPYNRAMTVHPWYFKEETRDAWNCDWYDFVMWQGAHVAHGNVPPTSTYRDSAKLGKPYLEGETQYEGIYGGKPQAVTEDDVRRAAWHALQSGCCGFTYGANGLWYPTQNRDDKTFAGDWGTTRPWWEAAEMPGPDQLAVMKRFYEKHDWFRYRPDADRLVLEDDYRDATRPLLQVDDRGHGILYCPQGSGKDRKIRLKTEPGRYEMRRFDPRTGKETELAEIAAENGLLTIPDRPDELDWVFTLQRK